MSGGLRSITTATFLKSLGLQGSTPTGREVREIGIARYADLVRAK